MARWIYSLLMYLALPVVFLFFWLRGRRDPAYRRGLSQRLGHIDADATPGVCWYMPRPLARSLPQPRSFSA